MGELARAFSVATRYETVEEFIEKYQARLDERSIFVPTADPRQVGTECRFSILLADKQPVLAGSCVVLESFADSNNSYRQPGMRLGLKELQPDSEEVIAELGARATARRLAADVVLDADVAPVDARAFELMFDG